MGGVLRLRCRSQSDNAGWAFDIENDASLACGSRNGIFTCRTGHFSSAASFAHRDNQALRRDLHVGQPLENAGNLPRGGLRQGLEAAAAHGLGQILGHVVAGGEAFGQLAAYRWRDVSRCCRTRLLKPSPRAPGPWGQGHVPVNFSKTGCSMSPRAS